MPLCGSGEPFWYNTCFSESPCDTYKRLQQQCNPSYTTLASPAPVPTTPPGDQCSKQYAHCCCNEVAFQLSMLCMNCQLEDAGLNDDGVDAVQGSYETYFQLCPNGSTNVPRNPADNVTDAAKIANVVSLLPPLSSDHSWSLSDTDNIFFNEQDKCPDPSDLQAVTSVAEPGSSRAASTASSSSSTTTTAPTKTGDDGMTTKMTPTTTTTSPTSPDSGQKPGAGRSVPLGAVVGAVIGAVAVTAILMITLWCWRQRRLRAANTTTISPWLNKTHDRGILPVTRSNEDIHPTLPTSTPARVVCGSLEGNIRGAPLPSALSPNTEVPSERPPSYNGRDTGVIGHTSAPIGSSLDLLVISLPSQPDTQHRTSTHSITETLPSYRDTRQVTERHPGVSRAREKR